MSKDSVKVAVWPLCGRKEREPCRERLVADQRSVYKCFLSKH